MDNNLCSAYAIHSITVTDSERYRIVGQTLIINQDNYVINATFRMEGNRLYLDTGKRNIVMKRM